jgi:vanillate O-demethylase ferredoxin subunit
MHDWSTPVRVLTHQRTEEPLPAGGAARTLLLAGGIGVTPILAMAEALAAAGAEFEMHYCARSPQRAAFRERIGASAFSRRCISITTRRRGAEARPGGAAGRRRWHYPPVCVRAAGLHRHVLGRAKAHGMAGRPAARRILRRRPRRYRRDQPFDVKLAVERQGGDRAGRPDGDQVLAEQGVDMPYSCEEGVCGTCLTRVLDGVPEHRDLYLTEEEQAANDQFTPCCSRARTPQRKGWNLGL